VKTVADRHLLFIVTNTANKLSKNTNIDDLERPSTTKNKKKIVILWRL